MTGTNHSGIVIQARDRHLLQELNTMRVVSREQAKIVGGFRSTTRVNARLLALTRAGLLKRIFIGGNLAVYAPHGAKFDSKVPAALFASHQLAINDIYLTVRFRPLPLEVLFLRWVRFDQTLSKMLPLIPDAYLELAFRREIRPAFLEVDLGTEALNVWQRKTQLYLQLALSGEFQKTFAQPKFRVLVIASTERRLQNIRATIGKSTDKVFWFSSFELINRSGFFSPIWLRPHGDQRLAL